MSRRRLIAAETILATEAGRCVDAVEPFSASAVAAVLKEPATRGQVDAPGKVGRLGCINQLRGVGRRGQIERLSKVERLGHIAMPNRAGVDRNVRAAATKAEGEKEPKKMCFAHVQKPATSQAGKQALVGDTWAS